jgi:transposase
MIDYENFCKIKKLHKQDGLNASQIAGELGLDQRTVAKWLTEERYRPRKKYSKASILDPFKAEIGRMIERHPYTATQIFQHLQQMGFQGSYNTIKRYVRKIRPKRSPAPAARLCPRRMRPGGLGFVWFGKRG